MVSSLYITKTFSRKHASSSDESIENLLYFKDCQKSKTTTTQLTKLRADVQPTPSPKQPDCPFPKMCCTMSCGNDCANPQSSVLSRQMQPLQNLEPIQPMQAPPRQPHLPVQPQIPQRPRKKKLKLPLNPTIPIGGRRDSGFTREKIKSLISQDGDIRKILKDLVRVTMQKVDLLEMVNGPNKNYKNNDASANSEEYE